MAGAGGASGGVGQPGSAGAQTTAGAGGAGAASVTAGSGGSQAGAGGGGMANAMGGAGGSGAGALNAGAGGGTSGAAGTGASGASSYEPVASAKFDEMPLFEGQPPNFKANAPAETVNAQGSISNVSIPTLRRFPMDASKATGFGYIVFPGGAYTGLDMDTHATRLAERVGPQGIAVFALKYRVGSGSNDAKRDALIDAKRAVRMVKRNAARWGVVVEHVGVIGYSAGSHLALNLAGNFDSGNVIAADPVEQQSSRPAFVGSMSTWADYKPESPFTFPTGVPPVYFCHAEDDTLAPIALARTVDTQVRAKGGATQLDFYKTGGHSTCHPGDPKMEGHDWPNKLLPWVQTALP
ncbi:MAG TPA: alpha/beta hydrolase [Polyangiaceae bacterium]|nr:alpha/beta hydrolase [Polyangiaceae bacterium]